MGRVGWGRGGRPWGWWVEDGGGGEQARRRGGGGGGGPGGNRAGTGGVEFPTKKIVTI